MVAICEHRPPRYKFWLLRNNVSYFIVPYPYVCKYSESSEELAAALTYILVKRVQDLTSKKEKILEEQIFCPHIWTCWISPSKNLRELQTKT